MAREVAKIYLSEKLINQTTTEIKKKIVPVELLNQNILQSYIGSFRSELNDKLRKVTEENGKLYYVRNPSNKEELVYQGNDDFIMKESELIVKFIRENNNNIVSAMNVYTEEVIPTHFESYIPCTFKKEELQGLSGNFFSEELNVTWKADVGDSTLRLTSLLNQESSSFTLITANTFFDSLSGLSIDLIRDKSKQVIGFYMSMNRVRKIHFKKN